MGGLRDTEKPNFWGWLMRRRLRRVDFPAPEGPEMTRRGVGIVLKGRVWRIFRLDIFVFLCFFVGRMVGELWDDGSGDEKSMVI